jgi:hypothetical protein
MLKRRVNREDAMKEKNVVGLVVLGLCILGGLAFSGYFIGQSLIKFKSFERTVTVKGLSEREMPADIALWPISFISVSNDLEELYGLVETNTQTIIDFLKVRGFDETEITISSPNIADKLAQGYEKARIEFRYTADQTITVYSEKVNPVREAMGKLVALGKKGILFSANYENRIEYLFTGLNDIKPEMVEEATNKAREVAEKFAMDSKSRLGKIKKASQGQFSIENRDSNNPHIKKIRVVSTVEYYLSD